MLISMLKYIKIHKRTPTDLLPDDDLLRSKHFGYVYIFLCILTLKSEF